ncbi:PREDICTED: THO complex subunit 7 homolog [Rhagoletis zephyria]|uniref:THO complex subunit 7 homolog n=1 Tax=Rhagoletis zephyria TaxID=28612 RepID=UPI000811A4BF|nr:PREDICTED: THO complex subunit 7 homolog [Rhagoletis zephyria]
MTTDDEIMKKKLLIDGDGIGDDRKLSQLIKSLILWCYNDGAESELESDLSAARLLMAIDQSELAMAKSVQTIRMISIELENYETLYRGIERSIAGAREKLATCKLELAEAKQHRCNKLDYDSVASIIEHHPSTQETQLKLNQLEGEIASLQKINAQIEGKLEKRRRQFQLLLSASHQLQSTLDDEDGGGGIEEGGRKGARGGGSAEGEDDDHQLRSSREGKTTPEGPTPPPPLLATETKAEEAAAEQPPPLPMEITESSAAVP